VFCSYGVPVFSCGVQVFCSCGVPVFCSRGVPVFCSCGVLSPGCSFADSYCFPGRPCWAFAARRLSPFLRCFFRVLPTPGSSEDSSPRVAWPTRNFRRSGLPCWTNCTRLLESAQFSAQIFVYTAVVSHQTVWPRITEEFSLLVRLMT